MKLFIEMLFIAMVVGTFLGFKELAERQEFFFLNKSFSECKNLDKYYICKELRE